MALLDTAFWPIAPVIRLTGFKSFVLFVTSVSYHVYERGARHSKPKKVGTAPLIRRTEVCWPVHGRNSGNGVIECIPVRVCSCIGSNVGTGNHAAFA